jgi:hypothetical protein
MLTSVDPSVAISRMSCAFDRQRTSNWTVSLLPSDDVTGVNSSSINPSIHQSIILPEI